jgi:hypothetical protein
VTTQVTEALEDHMRVLTEHNDKMKEIEKVRKDLTGDSPTMPMLMEHGFSILIQIA